uniref:Uncharacterized protein n=1 Tax=Hyaloperonospora arabidopsidis (strain Emoy2) TaxID=559515 RepID=M4B986_HYAAE
METAAVRMFVPLLVAVINGHRRALLLILLVTLSFQYEFHEIQDEVKKISLEVSRMRDIRSEDTGDGARRPDLSCIGRASVDDRHLVAMPQGAQGRGQRLSWLQVHCELHDSAEAECWLPHQLVVFLGRQARR